MKNATIGGIFICKDLKIKLGWGGAGEAKPRGKPKGLLNAFEKSVLRAASHPTLSRYFLFTVLNSVIIVFF